MSVLRRLAGLARRRSRPAMATATAVQWFKNGDHPRDYVRGRVDPDDTVWTAEYRRAHGWEGDVVRYHRRPDPPGDAVHGLCGAAWDAHGWLDTSDGGHAVCPGDWVVTSPDGKFWPTAARPARRTRRRP